MSWKKLFLFVGLVLLGTILCLNDAEPVNQETISASINEVTPVTAQEAPVVQEERPRILAIKEISRGGERHNYVVYDNQLKSMSVRHMKATAYTLSVASCGKARSNPGYGITATGNRAAVDETISVNPQEIPLGSVMYIEFPEPFESKSGIYVADDTGGGIYGGRIDVFYGEDKPGEHIVEKQALKFGVRAVKVYVIEKGCS